MRLLPYLVVCIIHLGALVTGAEIVARVSAVLAVPLLAPLLLPVSTRARWAGLAAIVASWVGDNVGLLLPPGSAAGLPAMLAAFAVAHVAYVVGFLPAARRRTRWLLGLAFALVAWLVLDACWATAGAIRPAVASYAVLLAATATVAASAGWPGLAGGAAFIASDGLLALRISRPDLGVPGVVIMTFYFAAQALLVLALRRLPPVAPAADDDVAAATSPVPTATR